MKTVAIRGAISVSENNEKAIETATIELFNEVLKNNNITPNDIAYMTFSATKDITKAYPAKFIRTVLGISHIPMMCYQEMDVENSLEMCIRALIVINTINADFSATHVYLKNAQNLRPDLKK